MKDLLPSLFLLVSLSPLVLWCTSLVGRRGEEGWKENLHQDDTIKKERGLLEQDFVLILHLVLLSSPFLVHHLQQGMRVKHCERMERGAKIMFAGQNAKQDSLPFVIM